jgi:hypothetical protein
MATIKPTTNKLNDDAMEIRWTGVTENDTFEAHDGASEYADRSFQLCTTIGGATVKIQGSNDGLVYYTLNDPFGNALSLTGLNLKGILEYTRYIKPLATGGSSQALDVIIVAKKPRLA